jgi:hypothetical protein
MVSVATSPVRIGAKAAQPHLPKPKVDKAALRQTVKEFNQAANEARRSPYLTVKKPLRTFAWWMLLNTVIIRPHAAQMEPATVCAVAAVELGTHIKDAIQQPSKTVGGIRYALTRVMGLMATLLGSAVILINKFNIQMMEKGFDVAKIGLALLAGEKLVRFLTGKNKTDSKVHKLDKQMIKFAKENGDGSDVLAVRKAIRQEKVSPRNQWLLLKKLINQAIVYNPKTLKHEVHWAFQEDLADLAELILPSIKTHIAQTLWPKRFLVRTSVVAHLRKIGLEDVDLSLDNPWPRLELLIDRAKTEDDKRFVADFIRSHLPKVRTYLELAPWHQYGKFQKLRNSINEKLGLIGMKGAV